MYDVEMNTASEEFVRCWQAAGRYIQSCTHDASMNWLKADLNPPFLEHLSFRLGNQLFFIRIEDVERHISGPGNPQGAQTIAAGCNGHACIMPMRRTGGEWLPDASGWGLLDAETRRSLDPISLVTDEKIEMSDWELQDFAVQNVRDYITQKLKHELMSAQGNPNVDPSIWFVGDQGPEWVVVRAVRYPEKEAALPSNIRAISESCSHLSDVGHFASVSVANSEDEFDTANGVSALPLWRGYGMFVRFEGLLPAVVQ